MIESRTAKLRRQVQMDLYEEESRRPRWATLESAVRDEVGDEAKEAGPSNVTTAAAERQPSSNTTAAVNEKQPPYATTTSNGATHTNEATPAANESPIETNARTR
jgi:hypothetical protein